MSDKYGAIDSMTQEISGFGGGYEQACRAMLKAGLTWLDDHPDADPQFSGYEGIYGVISTDNDDAKALSSAAVAAAESLGGATGAMHQAVMETVMFIKKNGLEKYLSQMNKLDKKERINPYVGRLAHEFRAIYQEDGNAWEQRLAKHVIDTIVTPKNERIHKLTGDLMRLQSSLHKLDLVLATHNAGVCRDGEPPVDCAIRLLSPVPDKVPARDRP